MCESYHNFMFSFHAIYISIFKFQSTYKHTITLLNPYITNNNKFWGFRISIFNLIKMLVGLSFQTEFSKFLNSSNFSFPSHGVQIKDHQWHVHLWSLHYANESHTILLYSSRIILPNAVHCRLTPSINLSHYLAGRTRTMDIN